MVPLLDATVGHEGPEHHEVADLHPCRLHHRAQRARPRLPHRPAWVLGFGVEGSQLPHFRADLGAKSRSGPSRLAHGETRKFVKSRTGGDLRWAQSHPTRHFRHCFIGRDVPRGEARESKLTCGIEDLRKESVWQSSFV